MFLRSNTAILTQRCNENLAQKNIFILRMRSLSYLGSKGTSINKFTVHKVMTALLILELIHVMLLFCFLYPIDYYSLANQYLYS